MCYQLWMCLVDISVSFGAKAKPSRSASTNAYLQGKWSSTRNTA